MSSTGNPAGSPPGNSDQYKTLIANIVAIVLAPLTAKYVNDAAQQQTIYSAATAIILGLINLAPVVYEMARKPSAAAMAVAVQADKVMADTGPSSVTVATGPGKPDITVKAAS